MLTRFPIIVGPTAGGKSALALALSAAIPERTGHGSAVVSADSMQVFRGMDIGTAKPTVEERGLVSHHLIDIVEPEESFSVDRWLGLAEPLLEELRGRGIVPIVVGGTHLYAKTLLEGMFEGPEPDPDLRAALSTMDPRERRRELERVDPRAAERLHPNDHRRTIRALEVYRSTGRPISELQAQWDRARHRSDALLVGLEWEPEAINRRINERVRRMVDRGLITEARGLWEGGRLGAQASQALGYKQLAVHFEGNATLEEAIEATKIETRRFAKNQRTWLRRLRTTPGSVWIPGEEAEGDQWIQVIVDQLVTTNHASGGE